MALIPEASGAGKMSAPSVAAVRLAEVVASLSLATDLGVGQPMQHALRACLLGLSLGEALGLDEEALGLVYYVALLQRVGCTADAFELTAWFDDDLAPHARAYELDFGKPLQVIGDLLRYAGAGRSPLDRLRTLGGRSAGARARSGRCSPPPARWRGGSANGWASSGA